MSRLSKRDIAVERFKTLSQRTDLDDYARGYISAVKNLMGMLTTDWILIACNDLSRHLQSKGKAQG
jgi:hypothetical protein